MDASNNQRRFRLRQSIIWIILVVIIWYELIYGIFVALIAWLLNYLANGLSDSLVFIINYYSLTLISVITLGMLCLFKGNRYIWRSFLPARRKNKAGSYELLSRDDFNVELYGRSRNTPRMLLIGLLLGFLTNFGCILCALIHGDIKLYFESSWSQVPVFLFAFISTFIQSSSEEMWCRGFMYERINERYPLWVSVAVNGIFFGLMHMLNPSVSVLSITGIIICGFSYSLLRWYSGSIWVAMGIHTGWNFTQNFLFGLPNSGLISEVSLFHLDAANGINNLIYDYGFGVEGALPALFFDSLVGIICLILAKRDGRLGELLMSSNKLHEDYEQNNNRLSE